MENLKCRGWNPVWSCKDHVYIYYTMDNQSQPETNGCSHYVSKGSQESLGFQPCVSGWDWGNRGSHFTHSLCASNTGIMALKIREDREACSLAIASPCLTRNS